MSAGPPEAGSAAADEEEVVAGYLREHPDFLLRHPDLVDGLLVPHTCGEAVSLVEYQSRRLREENRELRRRFQTLIHNARENQELGRRAHLLTLRLMRCEATGELFSCLHEALREHFGADFSAVRVFASPASPADPGLAEFAGAGAPERELFDTVLSGGRPLCGPLGSARAAGLFGEEGPEVASGALVPFGRPAAIGVLAVGSRDPEHYRPGMGTVFLRQIASVFAQVLDPHLAK